MTKRKSDADLFSAELTPQQELASILGQPLAGDFIAHRKAVRKPLTAGAARLMVKHLKGLPDPIGSAEQSIRCGWADIYPVKPPEGSLQKVQTTRPTMAGLFENMETYFGSDGQAGGGQAPQGNLLGIPFDGRKH